MSIASGRGSGVAQARQRRPLSPGQVALACLVGTAIEWYDFFVYGTSVVLVLGPLFFPADDPLTSSLLAFSTLGVGFLARPVGAAVLAHLGDRVGRRHSLILSLMIMGVATASVGLLPTYQHLGPLAPVLLVLLRCAQGFAVGGEWGGAVLLAVEHAPPARRGWYGSFPQYGTPLGLAGSALAILLAEQLSGEDFLVWGWRIPFLFSLVLVVVGLWVRLRVDDGEEFLVAKRDGRLAHRPMLEVLRRHPRALVAGTAVTLVCHAAYILTSFYPAYAATRLGLSASAGLIALMAGSVVSSAVLAVVSRWSDRTDGRRFAGVGAVLPALWVFPAFALASAWGAAGLVTGLAVALGCLMVQYAVLPSLLAAQFPVAVRYSGVSVCFQASAVLGGGLLPILASSLVGMAHGAYWPAACLLVIAGAITLAGAVGCRKPLDT
jgi:MFS family permease